MRFNSEEIKLKSLNPSQEVIYKGRAIFEEIPPVCPSLSKKVPIKLEDGQLITGTIVD
jgi:hypothetical protein